MSASYKREAYRGSEFAPRILADNNISVVMNVCVRIHGPSANADIITQSDHPAMNGRYLM